MNDKVTPLEKKKSATDESVQKFVYEVLKATRPKSWPLAKFAWYSFLAFIGTACAVGAVWMLMAFAERWL